MFELSWVQVSVVWRWSKSMELAKSPGSTSLKKNKFTQLQIRVKSPGLLNQSSLRDLRQVIYEIKIFVAQIEHFCCFFLVKVVFLKLCTVLSCLFSHSRLKKKRFLHTQRSGGSAYGELTCWAGCRWCKVTNWWTHSLLCCNQRTGTFPLPLGSWVVASGGAFTLITVSAGQKDEECVCVQV